MDPGGSIAQGEASPRGLSQGYPGATSSAFLPSRGDVLCAIFKGFVIAYSRPQDRSKSFVKLLWGKLTEDIVSRFGYWKVGDVPKARIQVLDDLLATVGGHAVAETKDPLAGDAYSHRG